MSDDLKQKTKETAGLYFGGWPGEVPYSLWRSFDPDLARDLSLFITGRMYSRQKIDHKTRQLVTIAALTALERTEELELHIWAGLNVGCAPEDIAEAIFQVFTYAGMPVVNQALKALRRVLDQREEG